MTPQIGINNNKIPKSTAVCDFTPFSHLTENPSRSLTCRGVSQKSIRKIRYISPICTEVPLDGFHQIWHRRRSRQHLWILAIGWGVSSVEVKFCHFPLTSPVTVNTRLVLQRSPLYGPKIINERLQKWGKHNAMFRVTLSTCVKMRKSHIDRNMNKLFHMKRNFNIFPNKY